jgi:Na+-translocating ferredoxin:NAD+ oxidoreductase RnfE subunit
MVFASKNRIMPSILDGLAMGLGFSFALVVLGGFREVLGSGTLLAQADLLVVASPSPKLLITVLLTASKGHKPNRATRA